ncbi:MAG: RNA polymerase subunit sigma-70, partial [Planctomycetota bacterium]|nr:RNA polymerase subunit sigma-70 [Planctomycetota bacterium]
MAESTNQLVEHFFRHEYANLVAVMTRAFGMRRIDLVEDMVQVAMLEAMHAWKQRGIPDNPTG